MNTSDTTMYEWDQTPWRKLERSVYKLQKRIYRASSRGDVKAVHKLQRLLIKSRGATLLAVRRVTQDNHGKKTAGIDGLASLSESHRLTLPEASRATRSLTRPSPFAAFGFPNPARTRNGRWGFPSWKIAPDRRWQNWYWSRNGRLSLSPTVTASDQDALAMMRSRRSSTR